MRRPARIRYDGPVYGSQPGVLCLYCIQSGEAARRLGVPAVGPAMFSDAVDVPDDVPAAVVDEVVQRTPGFHAWREGHWLYHCGDAAAFLGLAGYAELTPYPDAVDSLRDACRRYGWPEERVEGFLRRLDKEGEPTAYLFRCPHCGRHLAYWDIG